MYSHLLTGMIAAGGSMDTGAMLPSLAGMPEVINNRRVSTDVPTSLQTAEADHNRGLLPVLKDNHVVLDSDDGLVVQSPLGDKNPELSYKIKEELRSNHPDVFLDLKKYLTVFLRLEKTHNIHVDTFLKNQATSILAQRKASPQKRLQPAEVQKAKTKTGTYVATTVTPPLTTQEQSDAKGAFEATFSSEDLEHFFEENHTDELINMCQMISVHVSAPSDWNRTLAIKILRIRQEKGAIYDQSTFQNININATEPSESDVSLKTLKPLSKNEIALIITEWQKQFNDWQDTNDHTPFRGSLAGYDAGMGKLKALEQRRNGSILRTDHQSLHKPATAQQVSCWSCFSAASKAPEPPIQSFKPVVLYAPRSQAQPTKSALKVSAAGKTATTVPTPNIELKRDIVSSTHCLPVSSSHLRSDMPSRGHQDQLPSAHGIAKQVSDSRETEIVENDSMSGSSYSQRSFGDQLLSASLRSSFSVHPSTLAAYFEAIQYAAQKKRSQVMLKSAEKMEKFSHRCDEPLKTAVHLLQYLLQERNADRDFGIVCQASNMCKEILQNQPETLFIKLIPLIKMMIWHDRECTQFIGLTHKESMGFALQLIALWANKIHIQQQSVEALAEKWQKIITADQFDEELVEEFQELLDVFEAYYEDDDDLRIDQPAVLSSAYGGSSNVHAYETKIAVSAYPQQIGYVQAQAQAPSVFGGQSHGLRKLISMNDVPQHDISGLVQSPHQEGVPIDRVTMGFTRLSSIREQKSAERGGTDSHSSGMEHLVADSQKSSYIMLGLQSNDSEKKPKFIVHKGITYEAISADVSRNASIVGTQILRTKEQPPLSTFKDLSGHKRQISRVPCLQQEGNTTTSYAFMPQFLPSELGINPKSALKKQQSSYNVLEESSKKVTFHFPKRVNSLNVDELSHKLHQVHNSSEQPVKRFSSVDKTRSPAKKEPLSAQRHMAVSRLVAPSTVSADQHVYHAAAPILRVEATQEHALVHSYKSSMDLPVITVRGENKPEIAQ